MSLCYPALFEQEDYERLVIGLIKWFVKAYILHSADKTLKKT